MSVDWDALRNAGLFVEPQRQVGAREEHKARCFATREAAGSHAVTAVVKKGKRRGACGRGAKRGSGRWEDRKRMDGVSCGRTNDVEKRRSDGHTEGKAGRGGCAGLPQHFFLLVTGLRPDGSTGRRNGQRATTCDEPGAHGGSWPRAAESDGGTGEGRARDARRTAGRQPPKKPAREKKQR